MNGKQDEATSSATGLDAPASAGGGAGGGGAGAAGVVSFRKKRAGSMRKRSRRITITSVDDDDADDDEHDVGTTKSSSSKRVKRTPDAKDTKEAQDSSRRKELKGHHKTSRRNGHDDRKDHESTRRQKRTKEHEVARHKRKDKRKGGKDRERRKSKKHKRSRSRSPSSSAGRAKASSSRKYSYSSSRRDEERSRRAHRESHRAADTHSGAGNSRRKPSRRGSRSPPRRRPPSRPGSMKPRAGKGALGGISAVLKDMLKKDASRLQKLMQQEEQAKQRGKRKDSKAGATASADANKEDGEIEDSPVYKGSPQFDATPSAGRSGSFSSRAEFAKGNEKEDSSVGASPMPRPSPVYTEDKPSSPASPESPFSVGSAADQAGRGTMAAAELTPVAVRPEDTAAAVSSSRESKVDIAAGFFDESVNAADDKMQSASIWDASYMGCRSVRCYERLNCIDQGTFGVVYRARCKETQRVYALKRIKLEKAHGGFPVTSLREINILLALKHKNVIELREIVVDENTQDVYMVMEYMDHDLKMVLITLDKRKKHFRQGEVKCLMRQLLSGVAEMHKRWIVHRDLKASNLLMDNKGTLKICDFGLARKYGSPIGKYTQLVVTLWYRAPEILLGSDTYTPTVDMWSVGCIMVELLTCKPLFPGKGEMDQIQKIFGKLGTPTEETWPGYEELPHVKNWKFRRVKKNKLRDILPVQTYTEQQYLSEVGFDLLSRMLTYDPQKRISAEEALRHPWFSETPRAIDPSMMPTFPSLNEDAKERRRAMASPGLGVPVNQQEDAGLFFVPAE